MRRLQGWTEIADYMERSEKWCWRWSKDPHPPGERLPVYKIGGIVCADADDLEAWKLALKARAIGSTTPYEIRRR